MAPDGAVTAVKAPAPLPLRIPVKVVAPVPPLLTPNTPVMLEVGRVERLVSRVPVVGKVMLVAAEALRVMAKAPTVPKFPASVIDFPVLATPVPPYCPATTPPFQTLPEPSVLLVSI